MLKKFLIISVLFLIFSQMVYSNQISLPQNPPLKITPSDPILFEKVEISNDINMQYTINLKNNGSYTISVKDLKVEIYHVGSNFRGAWAPSIELRKPSLDTQIQPKASFQLIYKCNNSREEILKQMDEGILTYNSPNHFRISIKYKDRYYTYEGDFLWKPQLADLKVNNVEIEDLHETKSGFHFNYLKVSIELENIGDMLPIFLKDKNQKTLETSFVKIIVRRKSDKKIVAVLNAYPEINNERENNLSIYIDTNLMISPKEKRKLTFKAEYSDPFSLIGDFDITIGFDAKIEESNIIYYHFFGDKNWQNNIVTKSVSFGINSFEIISFCPEKLSSISPALATPKEFPRKENNLIYIRVNSYLPLTSANENEIKVYFNNELLRIFSIKFLDFTKNYSKYLIWIEKPKKIERGQFKIDILGISKFSNYLEIENKFTGITTSSSAPFYFDSVPIYYASPDDGKSPYGLCPISIEDINLRGNAPMNLSIILRPKNFIWLERGKGWSDVQKENPNADLSKYVSSMTSVYKVYVYVRPKDKIAWNFIDSAESPITLYPDKRNIINFSIDEVKNILKGNLKGGVNEILIFVTYTYKDEEIVKEVISDMYWTEFTIK